MPSSIFGWSNRYWWWSRLAECIRQTNGSGVASNGTSKCLNPIASGHTGDSNSTPSHGPPLNRIGIKPLPSDDHEASAAELVIRSTGAGLSITAPVTLSRGAGPSSMAPVRLFRSARSVYHGFGGSYLPAAGTPRNAPQITCYSTSPATGGQEGSGN